MVKRVLFVLVLGITAASSAWAGTCSAPEGGTVIDLTTRGARVLYNGAIFEQIDPRSTGSGVIDPFVRINPGGSVSCEQGYNTSARKLEFDENSSPTFTHDLLLADVPSVHLPEGDFYQFMLDINQSNSGLTDHLLSLNKVEVYNGAAGGAKGYPGALGGLVYNLDAGGPAWIKLEYNLNSGSGSGDMFMYIPKSALTGPYVYLFTEFGENFQNTGGYEEWSIIKGPGASPSPSPSPFPGN
jgi:hypothetical protein